MLAIAYSRWAPEGSRTLVDFPPELPRTLAAKRAPNGDVRGVLTGMRSPSHVQILAAEEDADQPVGIYVVRRRGLVFLTEDDLTLLELHGASVALVIAGSRAGLFVRREGEPLQAVESLEEFDISDVPTEAERQEASTPTASTLAGPRAVPLSASVLGDGTGSREIKASRAKHVPWRWAACFALLAVAVPAVPATRLYLPGLRPTRGLTLRLQDSALKIAWDPGWPATLDIVEEGKKTSLAISPFQNELLYLGRGGDVDVSLTTGSRQETSRYVGLVR